MWRAGSCPLCPCRRCCCCCCCCCCGGSSNCCGGGGSSAASRSPRRSSPSSPSPPESPHPAFPLPPALAHLLSQPQPIPTPLTPACLPPASCCASLEPGCPACAPGACTPRWYNGPKRAAHASVCTCMTHAPRATSRSHSALVATPRAPSHHMSAPCAPPCAGAQHVVCVCECVCVCARVRVCVCACWEQAAQLFDGHVGRTGRER